MERGAWRATIHGVANIGNQKEFIIGLAKKLVWVFLYHLTETSQELFHQPKFKI